MKLDVAAIGCDSLAGSTHKWLMGPIGGGILYVRPERQEELDPLVMSVDYYRSAKPGEVNGQMYEYLGQRPDAMLPGLLAALDERDAIGEENIERIARANAATMRQKLSAKGVKVIGSGDPALWGTVLAADIKGMPDRHQDLYDNHKLSVSTSHIAGKTLLRISPHIYNTPDELDQVAMLVA